MFFLIKFITDVDVMPKKSRVATMLEFGRDLLRMHNNLEKANGGNGTNQQMLRVSNDYHKLLQNRIALIMVNFHNFRMPSVY